MPPKKQKPPMDPRQLRLWEDDAVGFASKDIVIEELLHRIDFLEAQVQLVAMQKSEKSN